MHLLYFTLSINQEPLAEEVYTQPFAVVAKVIVDTRHRQKYTNNIVSKFVVVGNK